MLTQADDVQLVHKIGDRAVHVCLEVTEVAGAVAEISERLSSQAQVLNALSESAAQMASSSAQIVEATKAAEEAGLAARGEMTPARTTLSSAIDGIRMLIEIMGQISVISGELESALQNVERVTGEISKISRQTNLLALNAKIESSRVGKLGAGFAVVAQEVKTLSHQTEAATKEIGSMVSALSSQMTELVSSARQGQARAAEARSATEAILSLYAGVESSVEAMEERSTEIAGRANEISDRSNGVAERIVGLSDGIRLSDESLKQTSGRIEQLHDISDELTTLTAAFTLTDTVDTPFVRCARDGASEIGAILSRCVEGGEISLDALFSAEYSPVPDTNPQQFTTPSIALLERVCSPIVERLAATNSQIASVGVFDRNGFLAVAIKELSQPQTKDVARNDAYSRNKRIYRNRATDKACASRAPFLLQGFRRVINGNVAVFKDASAPILINERHWGACRIIYRW